ncbi:MAG: hypothetical protein IIU86_00190 [Oscillospiraceae bacterium]|nr:hypothetical protein [Oscillospiraceae bacterium]
MLTVKGQKQIFGRKILNFHPGSFVRGDVICQKIVLHSLTNDTGRVTMTQTDEEE